MTFASYIGHVRQKNAETYELTLTDTRRVDLATQFLIAAGVPSNAILGTIGAESSTVEPNNPVFRVVAVDATVGAVMLVYDSGPLPSSTGAGQTDAGQTVGSDGKARTAHDDAFWAIIDQACIQIANTGQGFDYTAAIKYRAAFGLNIPTTFLMDGVAADILDGSGNYLATYTPIGMQTGLVAGAQASLPITLEPFQPDAVTFNGVNIPQGAIILPWGASQPAVNDTFKLRVYGVNQAKVFTTTGHPIDLLTQWWTNVGITYDPAAAAAVRHALGDDLAVVYRFDQDSVQDQTLYDVVQKYLTSPFGFSWRMDDQQRRVLFICRDLSLLTLPAGSFGPAGPLTPIETIGIDDLRDTNPENAFDLDERSIMNRVIVTWQQIRPWDAQLDGGDRPVDGMVAIPQPPIQIDYSTNGQIAVGGTPQPDSEIAGVKEWRIDLPGYIGQTVFGAPTGTVHAFDMVAWSTGMAIGVFHRVGRGAPLVNLQIIRGHSVADVGDLIATTADHVVNVLAGRFPTSQRIRDGGGSRILQVVQRTPNPEGPDLVCWDVGPGQQPATVPEFTLAVDATDPYHVAVATLTNGPDISAAGAGAQVVVQTAVGASEPTAAGQTVGTIDPAATVPAISLPPVNGGSTVWVRMLAAIPGLGPGVWSPWQSVDLTALPPPTGLAATAQPNGTDVLLTWTPGSTTFPEAVYQGTTLLAILPAGTSQYLVEGVSGSHTFNVYTIDPPPLAGQSTAASVSGAPTGGVTLTAPIDPAAFAGRHTAAGLLIIDGTYGLEVTATAIPSTVQFEVATETAVGAGTYGSYVIGAQLPAVQGGRTRFTTQATQNDGLRRQLRAKSTRNGATDSSYTTPQVVDPWAQQTLPPAPPRLTAIWGAGTLAVLLQGDPQTVSFKVAASPSGYPSDTTVRAATAIDATNNQAASGTLESGLVVNDLIYVSAFAYTQLAGGGTESAHAQAVFVYGGGAAPIDANYALIGGPDSRLPNSRGLVAIAPITLVDNGAGSTAAIGIDLSSAGLGGSFLGQISYREFLLSGGQRRVAIPSFPSSVTDAADFTGVTKLDHWWKDLSMAAQAAVRMQVRCVVALAGAKLAVQYYNGSTWRYLDGVSGPLISLAATGLIKGLYIPVEAAALADVEHRLVLLGGDDASLAAYGGLLLEWVVGAANATNPGGSGGSGGGGDNDCADVSDEAFEYATTAAAIAGGWTLVADPGGLGTYSTGAGLVGGSTYALQFNFPYSYFAGGTLIAQRTFGVADGLVPNQHYTVKVKCRQLYRPWYDVNTSLKIIGGEQVGLTGASNTVQTIVAHGISDSSGNLTIQLRRDGALESLGAGENCRWDALQILRGSAC